MKVKIATGTAACPLDAKMGMLLVNIECPHCKKTVTIKLTPRPPVYTVIERVEEMQNDDKKMSKRN